MRVRTHYFRGNWIIHRYGNVIYCFNPKSLKSEAWYKEEKKFFNKEKNLTLTYAEIRKHYEQS